MLDVSGALVLNVDGEDIALCASGSDIVLEVRNSRGFLKHAGSPWRFRRIIRLAADALNEAGLTLTISRNGRAFVMLGANARSTFIGRLVGIENVNLA